MVKGKRNGLTFTKCSVKICRFLPLSTDIENEATTVQRNRCVHTSARRSIDRRVMSQNEVKKKKVEARGFEKKKKSIGSE